MHLKFTVISYLRIYVTKISAKIFQKHLLHSLDYDKDGFIGQSDLKSVIKALTRNELTPEEHQQITDKVIEEADVDGDGKLSFLEFDHVVTRAPDFLNTFHIRL